MVLTVSTTEISRNFRAYLAEVEAGQVVVITHYRRPRAVLAPAARLLELLPQPTVKEKGEVSPGTTTA